MLSGYWMQPGGEFHKTRHFSGCGSRTSDGQGNFFQKRREAGTWNYF
jgi:hypothetical protein